MGNVVVYVTVKYLLLSASFAALLWTWGCAHWADGGGGPFVADGLRAWLVFLASLAVTVGLLAALVLL